MVSLRLSTSTAASWALRLVASSCCPRPHRFMHAGLSASMPSRRFGLAGLRLRQHRACASRVSPTPELLPLDTPVDEERVPGYKPEHYYPANPGDVLENRYQLDAKIGWGSSSTVWLAHDIQSRAWLTPKRHVAIKICNCDTSEEDRTHELDITMRISSANPQCPGRAILGTAIEGYIIKSSRGDKHLALVFEPMREPLWLFKRRITHEDRITDESLPFMKTYIRILLEGLDYMHSQCHIIHTDLKLDNIMVSFEDQSTIEAFVQGQATHPMARKHVSGHTVYRCHNDFGPITHGLGNMIPHITDFGLAQRGDKAEPLIHPIQPNEFRAPEVLFGIGWSYSADIWNFGAMIWELLTGCSLFRQPRTDPYSPAQHLADMITLIGQIPPLLIQRERDMRHWRWRPAALNPEGRLSSNAAEFYGGPFFTDDSTFTRNDLIHTGRNLESEVPKCILEENHAELFLKFIRRMLCWVPEERATAADLLNDPWLDPSTK
ncbi:Protein kinase-like domain protein [Tolypocladium paradoxum]|uniref:non-specific serine/threonine protein kinase n=1 Tax=Tolypocladium paradoxum TaxID=94208 RepID=A0A2S4KUV1_9HYPO|nr:Protein kinase-like domain protein [Tolypocladium paradoxum]